MKKGLRLQAFLLMLVPRRGLGHPLRDPGHRLQAMPFLVLAEGPQGPSFLGVLMKKGLRMQAFL